MIPKGKSHPVVVAGKVRHNEILEKDVYQSDIEFMGLKEEYQLAIREYLASFSENK